jgi:ABC-type uncharacterized transport system permease subunit
LPASVSPVLQGAILLFVLGGSVFNQYRLRLVRSVTKDESARNKLKATEE